MDLKSLILNPEKETISIINLDEQQIGYFLLGQNKIKFLGEKKPPPLIEKQEKQCISIVITDDSAYLDDFFLAYDKIGCTKLDSSIFFKLFDVILPEIGIYEFKLVDESYKSLKNCSWYLFDIGFFITGRTYYEKYGFMNEEHSTPDAKKRISELRNTTTLNELYLNDQDKLQEIYDKLILNNDTFKEVSFEDLKEILLKDFILNYVKPICESEYNKETYKLLATILYNIKIFLEKKGFSDRWFRKYYPIVEDKLKPEIFIESGGSHFLNIDIVTHSKGGKRKTKIYKKKSKRKTKGKSKNYKKKNNNHIKTNRQTRRIYL
uniref:Uncharacterized protein n=1 Tax=viral metagenome TaxID=1070528 RepID=A0A6C0IJP0_9ZZZZ